MNVQDHPADAWLPWQHVYVHVPFCARRCSYCDFAIAVRGDVPWKAYVEATSLELDIRQRQAATSTPQPIKTLYFGGGTPSHLGPDGVEALMEVLQEHFTWDNSAEVTLEANPEDISAQAVRRWSRAGINRLSIGMQSFHDNVLQWMHRVHDANAAIRSAHEAREGGIDNFSLDLIFATPDHLARSWKRDLDQALALEPGHISLYGLTVEPRTPLGRWVARGEVHEADEGRYEGEFLLAHNTLAAAGYEHYEVSNYAKPQRRALHNSAYWTGTPYLGLGPSAHGFDGQVRRWNIAAYERWLQAVKSTRDPRAGSELLSAQNRIAETVYLGMRTIEGLSVSQAEASHATSWQKAGWITLTPETAAEDKESHNYRLTCTQTGWLRLDTLAADLTAFRGEP